MDLTNYTSSELASALDSRKPDCKVRELDECPTHLLLAEIHRRKERLFVVTEARDSVVIERRDSSILLKLSSQSIGYVKDLELYTLLELVEQAITRYEEAANE